MKLFGFVGYHRETIIKSIIIRKLLSKINYGVKNRLYWKQVCITTLWKAFDLLNPNFVLLWRRCRAGCSWMFPLHCCSKVSLGSSSSWDLGSCCKTVGAFSRQGGRGKTRKFSKRLFFSFEFGTRAEHTGMPLWWQPWQHTHLEGLSCFWASNFSETLLVLQRWTTLLPHRCGVLASYNMWKLESVKATCSLFAKSGAARFQDHGWVRIWRQDLIRRGGGKLVSLCSQAVWELILAHELLAHWRPPQQQVLAHAMHESVPGGRCSLMLSSDYSWSVMQPLFPPLCQDFIDLLSLALLFLQIGAQAH